MGVVGRFKTGFVLTKQSVEMLWNNPRLAVFPAVSGAASLAFIAALLAPLLGVFVLDADGAVAVVGLLTVAGLYLGTAFISAFFAAALVDQTRAVLDGDEPSLRQGVRAAWGVKRQLFVWAIISATVGFVLDTINESSNSGVTQIISAVIGMAWTVLTFFVVPVIVFERPSVRGMFTRSGELFKQTYGETPISLIGTAVLALLLGLPLLGPGLYALFELELLAVGIPLVVAGLAVVQLTAYTLRGIVKTGLYFYAAEGDRPNEFAAMFDELDTVRGAESQNKDVGPGLGRFR
jgi:hypothetical protein